MQENNSTDDVSLDARDPLFYHPSAHPSRAKGTNFGGITTRPDDPRVPLTASFVEIVYRKRQRSTTRFDAKLPPYPLLPPSYIKDNRTKTYDDENDNDAEALLTVDRFLSSESLNAVSWEPQTSLGSPPPCGGSFVLRCLMRTIRNIIPALEPMSAPWAEPLDDLEQEDETCSETTYNSVGTNDSGDRGFDYPESPIAVAPEFMVTEKRIPSSILMPLDVPASNTCLRLDSDRLQATISKASFLCPLSHEIMMDPVIDPEGYSYERKAIMAWLSKSSVSPVSGQWLEPKQLIPNRGLQRIIQDFLQEQSEWSIDSESELTWSGNS